MPFAPRHLLVTGGAGFIGSNFVRWVLEQDPAVQVTNLDCLTYAGNLESLADVEQRFGTAGEGRYRFVYGDIRDFALVRRLLAGEPAGGASSPSPLPPDAIVHFAAESHVDRSILGPQPFVETNVNGTLSLLEAARAALAERPREFRFVHVSTDEVYGELGPQDPAFTEDTPLAPNSPYSASKAGSDFLVRAYARTFDLPAIITRCSNNYGPYQFPEKLIPLMITRALAGQPLPVYGDGQNVRDWLYVTDHAEALWAVLCRGQPGQVYNIGGECEVANLEIVHRILALLGKEASLIQFVPDRPGHDRRYAMNIGKIKRELGWRPRHRLDEGLRRTVEWYLANRTWWERVLSEAYRAANALYLVAAGEQNPMPAAAAAREAPAPPGMPEAAAPVESRRTPTRGGPPKPRR
jgi:dTDP-glucose 4,6-dehydratase